MSNNPFPGLRPFEQKETHLFFGRDGQSKELLKRLQDSRFLALVGVSGSGKSSLVRAGLLPALYGGLMSAVESDWRIAVFRPGNNPIRNMAHALITQAGLGGDSGFQDVEVAIAETTLRRGNLGLLELLKQAKRKVREDERPFLGPNENVLIVVDQFEEIFRIIEQYDELVRVKQLSEGNSDLAGTATADGLDYHPREEASAFVKLLLESTRQNKDKKYDENIYIIVTMRSDYLGETAQFWGMPERINEGQYLIPRMNRDERRKAIVGPVAVARGSIAEPLVNQLLNDAGENPGHLPILQHALMRMWELAGPAAQHNGGLNLDHYDRIGKLSGALSQHANEAFDELSPKHQELAAKVFKCLTEKGLANREIRRPMKIADICAVIGAREEDVQTVVDCFRKTGRWFLMPSPEEKARLGPDTLIDISHESLISGWDKLSLWVNEEAESSRTYKRLADTAILKERAAEEFYRGPALQLALKWRQDNAPNPAWARRYHPEFDKAIAFLDDSLKDTQKREKEEKDRVAKELRRRRTYNIILAILTLMTLTVGVFAVGLQRMRRTEAELREFEAIKLKNDAVRLKNDAVTLKNEAEDAKQIALSANAELEKSLKKEQDAVTAAQQAETVAIRERDNARRLQNENKEQAATYQLFKTAFDYVASKEYDKALSSLQDAMTYFKGKEDKALTASQRTESRTNRISTMVNIADVHRSKDDPASDELAIKKYDEAIDMIGSTDDKQLAPTLMKAGSVWNESENDELAFIAVAYYERAAGVYRRLGNNEDSSRAWFEAGNIHLGFNDEIGLPKALKDFNNAVGLLEGKQDQLASTSAKIGDSYMRLVADEAKSGDEEDDPQPVDNARRQQNKVKEQLREAGAGFFSNAATAFQDLGEFKRAADMQENVGKILSESQTPKLLNASAEAFIMASTLYGRTGDATRQTSVLLDAGEAFFQNESEIAKGLAARLLEQAANVDQKNVPKQAQALSRIGSIYANLDPPQKERALEYYERAIRFARQHNDKAAELAAIIEKVRAVEKLKVENIQSQIYELYDQVVRLYGDDAAKDVDMAVRFGRAVLGTSREEVRMARAEQFFEKALILAQKQPDKRLIASTHLDVGVAYGISRRQKATQNYQSALAIYEALGDLYGQAMALYRLGILGGTEAPQFVDRSLAIFAKVLPTLETSGKQKELGEAYYVLGALHRRKKNYQQALDNYNRALVIYERLPDQTARVSNIKTLIRTTQRLM